MNTIIGNSPWARAIRESIARVAPCNCPVLIEGPTGTGKELVARAIHAQSRRCEGPFVPVNCASVPRGLLPVNSSGTSRGPIRGPTAMPRGASAPPNGGTIFLDEIGELPPDIQAQLLRVIEGETVTPVGEYREIPIDVRVVCRHELRHPTGDGRRTLSRRPFLSSQRGETDDRSLKPPRRGHRAAVPLFPRSLVRREPGAVQAAFRECRKSVDGPRLAGQRAAVAKRPGAGDASSATAGRSTARQVRAALEADGRPAIATRIGIFAEDISSVLGVDASAVPVLRRVVLPACRPLLARRAGRLLGRLPDCRQGNVAHAGRVRAVQDSCGPGASGLQHKRGRAAAWGRSPPLGPQGPQVRLASHAAASPRSLMPDQARERIALVVPALAGRRGISARFPPGRYGERLGPYFFTSLSAGMRNPTGSAAANPPSGASVVPFWPNRPVP